MRKAGPLYAAIPLLISGVLHALRNPFIPYAPATQKFPQEELVATATLSRYPDDKIIFCRKDGKIYFKRKKPLQLKKAEGLGG